MNLKHLIRHSLVALAACAALGATSVAQSKTLKPTGFAYPPAESFGLADSGNNSLGSPSAGAFVGTLDNVPIVFFCAQLNQTFSFGGTYDYSQTLPNDPTFTLLGRLYTASFLSVDTSSESAAFQLAVWEILFGTDMNVSNSGDFHVTSGPPGTVAIAQGYLDFLVNNPNSSDSYDIYFLENREHQDFIYGGPRPTVFLVPEPAPLLLLGIALLAMIGVSRRRGSTLSV